MGSKETPTLLPSPLMHRGLLHKNLHPREPKMIRFSIGRVHALASFWQLWTGFEQAARVDRHGGPRAVRTEGMWCLSWNWALNLMWTKEANLWWYLHLCTFFAGFSHFDYYGDCFIDGLLVEISEVSRSVSWNRMTLFFLVRWPSRPFKQRKNREHPSLAQQWHPWRL